jgi:glucose-1-phosphate cytidylyltransferase
MHDGEELVLEPFRRLIDQQQLMAYEHNGFYASMDTFKDKQQLDDLYARGDAPWVVWKSSATQDPASRLENPKSGTHDSQNYAASRRDG